MYQTPMQTSLAGLAKQVTSGGDLAAAGVAHMGARCELQRVFCDEQSMRTVAGRGRVFIFSTPPTPPYAFA